MSLTMNSFVLKKRTIVFSLILILGFGIIDYLLNRYQIQEKKAQTSLEIFQSDKILSSEIYRLLYGLEDDFNFFERRITEIILDKSKNHESLTTLLDFLNTHPNYLKVRVTDIQGKEIFKIVQRKDHLTYEKSTNLFDLSGQFFFQDLKKVGHKEFYFSSMEANIINGVVELPIRPTIRVSKRIYLPDNKEALLIINIDGKKILQLFEGQTLDPGFTNEKILVDHNGFQIASYPLKSDGHYTNLKVTIPSGILFALKKQNPLQGSFIKKKDLINYTRIPLPRSLGTWYLLSTIPESSVKKAIYSQRLTRIFWECVIFCMMLTWFIRDEKKRHQEQVTQVLLKERSEFIQNVSHQIKTPLTIIHNYLNHPQDLAKNRDEICLEVHHLIKVVDDLLLLSQIETLQKIPLNKENILEILNEAVSLVGRKAQEKSISVRVNLQEELLDAIGAFEKNILKELLKSAFLNILDNAIDFSPSNSTISIFMGLFNSKILIRIQDQGPGVDKKNLENLFERKIKVSYHEGRKGTGLGLPITKKIIELHGGDIRYISGDVGATFEILI